MSKQAEALAQRIEQGANNLAEFARDLTDAEWQTPIPHDGRTVGTVIHHVASVYPIEIHLASVLASGKPITDVTWAVVADMNAKHAQEHAGTGRQETIELLLRNSNAAAAAVRALSDAELDSAAPVSLNADAPLTAQFIIEDHALRHSWHHLAKIKAALQKS